MDHVDQNQPSPRAPEQRHARGLRLLAMLFPLALFLSATLFLGGQLGKWNDDYFFFSQLKAETGEVENYVLRRPLHFWRPVYRWVAGPLNTALFEHDRTNHIITALAHGLASWMVYVLLRQLGVTRFAAAIGAMAFMVYPTHFEVAFWNTPMFTGAASTLVIAVWLMYLRWLERFEERGWLRRWWWLAPLVGVMTFIAAGMNEQPPAATLGMVALLAWFWWRARRREDRAPWGFGRLVVAVLPLGACVTALATYTIIHLRIFPPQVGGHTGGTVALDGLPDRAWGMALMILRRLRLGGMARGMWETGLETMAQHPVQTGVLGALLVIGGAAMVWRLRRDDEVCEPARVRPTRTLWLMLIGLAWCVAAWLPIVRINYPLTPRLYYAPDIGLAIVLAAVLDGLVSVFTRARRRVAARIMLAAGALAAMVVLGVMLIGAQRAYQKRWHADLAQGETLRRLVPAPPPWAAFVPMRIAHRHTPGYGYWFERHFGGAFEGEWAAGWYVQRLYRRADLRALMARFGPDAPVTALDADRCAIGSPTGLPWRVDAGATLRWDEIIPFEITREGEVAIITRIDATLPGGERVAIVPKITSRLAEEGRIPKRDFTLAPPRRAAEGERSDP